MDSPELLPDPGSRARGPMAARDDESREVRGGSRRPTLPAGLAEEDDWLRRLAGSVTRDPHLAEDIVQNAYLAALRSPPHDPARRRAWLRTTVRNFARLAYRESSRRSARERVVARDEAVGSHERLIEEAELRSLMAHAVATLEEPYRSTIIEHFYRDVPTREIAATEGVAPNTVRVRIRRAIGQLSASLDRKVEGRRAVWLLPFLAAFLDPAELAAQSAAAAAAEDAEAELPPEPARGPFTAAAMAPVAIVALLMVWIAIPADPASTAPDATSARTTPVAHSEGNSAPAPGTAEVGAGASLTPGAEVLAPSAAAGLPRVIAVTDRTTGAPLAGAEVLLDPVSKASERLARGRTPLEWLTLPFATTPVGRTDDRGRIELPPLSLGRDRLLVRASGYAEHRERAALRTDTDGVLAVALRPAGTGVVTVLLPGGAPAVGATVRVVGASGAAWVGVTDRAGKISYPVEEAAHAVEIDLPGTAAVRTLALPPEQTIELVPAVEVLVRVTDARGTAVAGATLRTVRADRTAVATDTDDVGRAFLRIPEDGSIESIVVAHPDHPTVRLASDDLESFPATIVLPDPAWIEGTVVGPDGTFTAGTVLAVPDGNFFARDLVRAAVDESGRFRLGPVSPGPVRLRAEADGLAPVELAVDALRAHETRTVDLSLPRGATLRGRVTTPDGRPAPGVRVQAGAVWGDELRGPVAETDAEGRFAIAGLPAEPPPVRTTVPEPRWTALGEIDALPERGWVLEVLRPHQLHSADGAEIPRFSFLGSRNTVALSAPDRPVALVVDPRRAGLPPRIELVTADGAAVRDVVNWLVLPPGDPSDRSLIFAGTDGNPVAVGDPIALEGSWIALLAREHAIAGGLYFLTDDETPWEVVLHRRTPRTLSFRTDAGEPFAGADLWWVPDDPDAFGAIALGRTGDDGRIETDALAPGRYRILARSTGGEPAVPERSAIAVVEGAEIGVLLVPPAGGTAIEVRVTP